MLRHLDMIAEDEVINTGITWLGDYQVITSPRSGIFRALTKDGYSVAEHAALGVLVDFIWERVVNNTSTFCRGGELRH